MTLGLRGELARNMGRLATWASRASGRGSGGMIGGRVALAVDPKLLAKVAEGKKVVIVTGTNGKSTTTAMVREALKAKGEVASNVRGDNMTDGVMAALLDAPNAEYAVLEVDELYIAMIAQAVRPAGFVLLNLSRDQLDRMGEITTVEARLRQAVDENPQAFVVANCDDPLIASATWDAAKPVWVSVGASWLADSVSFPRTSSPVVWSGDEWRVIDHPEFSRPEPDWSVRGNTLTHAGEEHELALALPGRANRGNAAQAIAAANQLGVPIEDAITRVNTVSEVSGRYVRVNLEGRMTRLLLAKNPAGWQEAMSMLDTAQADDPNSDPAASSIILSVNGQVGDGEDLSWIWDVDFTPIKGHDGPIVVCGERGTDVAVRLRYEGIDCSLVETTSEAVRMVPPGSVDLLANYTAFRDFKAVIPTEFGVNQ